MAATKNKAKKEGKKGAKKRAGATLEKARSGRPPMAPTVGRMVRMAVVPEPPAGTRTVLAAVGECTAPLLSGGGTEDLRCGSCGGLLVEQGDALEMEGIVILCPSCQSYNECLPHGFRSTECVEDTRPGTAQ